MVFPLETLEHTTNKLNFFWDYIILICQNDVMAEINKSLLIKLSKKIYIYNSINNIDINESKTDYIP